MVLGMTSEAVIIEAFPVYRFERAVAALGLVYAKHTRAALREGRPAPSKPTLEIARRYLARICRKCGEKSEAKSADSRASLGNACLACGFESLATRELCDLALTCERPVIAGWEFLAVVEPLVGGNLIRQVPGATNPADLSAYRNAKIECSHCKTTRTRHETFVIRHVETGELRQIGRQCLQSFLPGASVAWVIESIGIVREIRHGEGTEGDGWILGGEPIWTPAEVATWSAAVVRLDGWTPKSKATEMTAATAEIVSGLLDAPRPGPAYEAWLKSRQHYRPNDQDGVTASAALAWILAKDRADLGDYMYSLRILCEQPHVTASKLGIVVSLINAYGREIGESMRRRDVAGSGTASRHVGTIGERITVHATIERVVKIETPDSRFGNAIYIHAFRDAGGNVLVWTTGKSCGMAGDVFSVTGRVTEHGEYKGEAQTKISRCKLVPAQEST